MITVTPVEWALLFMQIALAAALWAMTRDLSARRIKANNARLLATANDKDLTQFQDEIFAVIDDLPAEPSSVDKFQISSLVLSTETKRAVEKAAAQWLTKAQATAKTSKKQLHELANRESNTAMLDAAVLLLNIIAFFGYLVFPATYFGPFVRDSYTIWLGNFAGDLAWTIEPALVLSFSKLSAVLTLRKEKIKAI
eukprot:CAMPEP_0197293612 /NCGR_PEP_ID=MMETSP0890-20130614/29351_1 /TAXON_ID=44058 ORGANISM="Aureoumbra lagunensis, Strain CCMP1510" /NCGR_SAMPLE_ID=MMETSP0890 /ASSEMBLY_ACC=CAM_ASM_000533 /LENGTH=195 /DNA_ID=CAMNT_0042768511 /DNA_START=365 /DNA_END=952 /DNA_ORIENTATION=+